MIQVVTSQLPAHLDVSLLRQNKGGVMGITVGGRFALPQEFDVKKYAAAFVPEGHEVLIMQQDQPILGSDRVAPGWNVWKYPGANVDPKNESKKSSSKSSKKSKKSRGVPELHTGQEHPMAGQPHKIPGSKAGESYVLMFRPLEVQQQVNALYGHLSRQAMVNETLGNTLNPEIAAAGGMLPNSVLNRVERDVEAEAEFAETGFGKTSTVGGVGESDGHRIKRQDVVVHK